MKIVTVWLPVICGNGFSLDAAAAPPLLWEEAGKCSAHPAEPQNQGIAPLPSLGFLSRTECPKDTPRAQCLVWHSWMIFFTAVRGLPVALTPLLLLDLFAAAAEIAAFPDLVTKQLEGSSSSSCGAGDPQSLRTLQMDMNTENSALCRCSELTGH